MSRSTTVKLGWSKHDENDEEQDFTLRVLVTPGYPATRHEPADGGEIEVLEVRDSDGNLRPDLIDEAQESLDEAEAFEAAEDASQPDPDYERDRDRDDRLDDTLAAIAGAYWRR